MNNKIIYYPNGNKHYEEYYNDLGEFHNELKPAYNIYYENGNKCSESYFINNKWHNAKGPARIWYYENGNIKRKQYYLNDQYINVFSDEQFQKYIKRLNVS